MPKIDVFHSQTFSQLQQRVGLSRVVSVHEERGEYPVLPVHKKASTFEADFGARSCTNGQNEKLRV